MQEEVSVCSKNLFLNHALLLSKIRLVSETPNFYGVVLRTPFFKKRRRVNKQYFSDVSQEQILLNYGNWLSSDAG